MFKVLYKVTAALVRQLIKCVNFPYRQQIRVGFYDISGFPYVITAMDRTHIIFHIPAFPLWTWGNLEIHSLTP